jgi:hypothetical protein
MFLYIPGALVVGVYGRDLSPNTFFSVTHRCYNRFRYTLSFELLATFYVATNMHFAANLFCEGRWSSLQHRALLFLSQNALLYN